MANVPSPLEDFQRSILMAKRLLKVLKSKETLRAARPLPGIFGFKPPLMRWTDEIYHESLAMTQIFAVAEFEALLSEFMSAKIGEHVGGGRQKLKKLGREDLADSLAGVFHLRNVILHRGGVVDEELAKLRRWQAGRSLTGILTVEVVSADIDSLEAAASQVAAAVAGRQ